MARSYVLTAAVLFGTTGTAQALGPEIEPLAVGTARIAIAPALSSGATNGGKALVGGVWAITIQ